MDPLKAILDTLDGVPEELQGLYEQKGDKFVLRLDSQSIREHPHVTALKNALDRTKDELESNKNQLSTAKERLDQVPENFDSSEYSRLVAEDTARKENPDGADKQLNSQREMYEERIRTNGEKHRKELSDRDAKLAGKQLQIDARDKDSALDQAIVASGIKKEFVPAVRALMRPKIMIEPSESGDGKPDVFIDTDMGRQDVSQFMVNWVQTDSGKVYVDQMTGGDSTGSSGRVSPGVDNPWSTANGRRPNLTAQQEIMKKNPALARRLASAAGAPIPAGI